MAMHPTPPGGGDNPPGHVPFAVPHLGGSRLEQALLPEESVAEFRALRLGIHEDLRPRGVFETWLVDRCFLNHWRMQRAAIGEAELIARRRAQATAWENPRRVKTPPSAGAVWGDDQQHYGGALEKLARHEYRLSLEASRILRDLAKRQKARRPNDGAGNADAFEHMLDGLREAKPCAPKDGTEASADTPRMAQIDNDELPAADELPPATGRQGDRREAAPPSDPVPTREAADLQPELGKMQNELPPVAGKTNSSTSHSNPISGGANSSTSNSKPIRGQEGMAQIDTEHVRAEIERRVNRHLAARSGPLSPLRQAAAPPLRATWVGSRG